LSLFEVGSTTPHPHGLGALEAIRASLADAGLGLEAVDYINLHGIGIRDNDASNAAWPISSIMLGRPNSSPTVLLPPTSNNFINPQWKTKYNGAQSPLWKPETTGGNSFPVPHNPQFKNPRRPIFYPLQTVPHCLNRNCCSETIVLADRL